MENGVGGLLRIGDAVNDWGWECEDSAWNLGPWVLNWLAWRVKNGIQPNNVGVVSCRAS